MSKNVIFKDFTYSVFDMWHKGHKGQGQRSHGSRSEFKVVGRRSGSQCQKRVLRTLLSVYDVLLRDQRSRVSRSKVTWSGSKVTLVKVK